MKNKIKIYCRALYKYCSAKEACFTRVLELSLQNLLVAKTFLSTKGFVPGASYFY